MATHARVSIDAKVMLGKPVIRGTRIPVELLLRKLSEGATVEDLLDAYPRLTRADLQAAIAYAADTVAHGETRVLTPQRSSRSGVRWSAHPNNFSVSNPDPVRLVG